MAMRTLSLEFKNSFLKGGVLHPFLQCVQNDRTLMLCIRDDYVNIYYQGGSIMKIQKNYTTTFDLGYFFPKETIPKDSDFKILMGNIEGNVVKERNKYFYVTSLKNEMQVSEYVNLLPYLKNTMDIFFSKDERAERAYQQIVCRENNRSRLSNSTAYFITDIEYAINMNRENKKQARVDMVAIKWSKSNRAKYKEDKTGIKVKNVKLAFIEMKYGVNALSGRAGLKDHMEDMKNILEQKEIVEEIRKSAEEQLNILNEFGLIEHTNKECRFKVEHEDKPEYIMLLSNLEPNRAKLEVCNQFSNDSQFNLRFFIANTAGYGLFEDCIVDYETFIKYVR